MRKLALIVAIAIVVMTIPTAALAASSVSYTTRAEVQGVLELAAILYEGDPGANIQASSMDFGDLVPSNGAGSALTGEKYYTMALYTNSSSRRYRLTSTGTALSNGSTTLPAGACIMTPTYADVLGTLGSQTSFIATDVPVYTSDIAGSSAEVQVVYAIPADPAAGNTEYIGPDQASGVYSSNVTITMSLL